jgi:hypothetical protein
MSQMNLSVAFPEGIDTDAKSALNVALAYQIDSADMYALAAEELRAIKGKAAALEAKRKELVGPINEAVKRINDFFRAPIEMLGRAESALKTGMIAFDDEQERIRRAAEEQARRDREAEERRVAAEAAEAQRLADEAVAAAERAATPEEHEHAQVALAEAAAKVESTQQARAEIATMPTPIVAKGTPKIAGLSPKKTWRGECTDFMALVKAVAAGTAPINLLELNQTQLNKYARAQESALSFPGCKAVEEKTLASARG